MRTPLTSNDLGLWWSALTCTLAGTLCAWGAMRGIIQHRIPRIAVAVAVSMIAITYWADILVLCEPSTAADWRRGAGWILWPALAWTAWSGAKYSRRVVAAASDLMGPDEH